MNGAVGAVGPMAQLADAIRTTLREDPGLALLALVLVAAIALVVWGVARWLRRPMGVRFVRALDRFDEVTVLMHPNPDPDAMACAMGVAALAEYAGVDVTLQHPGRIRHQENRAFRTVLDLDVERIERAADLAANAVVLVDHNVPRGFEGSEDVEPVAVLDHHPGDGEGSVFTDVRPDYGAAATILAEYFQANGAERVAPDTEAPETTGRLVCDSPLATGLMYGIQSDTNHLTSGCTEAEFSAAAYLYPAVDADLLDRIANPQVDADILQIKSAAISERDVRGPFAISDVGECQNADAIPQAADELMHLEGVTAVIVLGNTDGTLHISGRSRDDRVHMGKTLEDITEDIPLSSGGGHARMGGGQISIEHMHGIGPGNGLSREDLRERLFDALAGEA